MHSLSVRFSTVAFLLLCLAHPASSQVCGNTAVEAGEACDDGNVVGGDCCSAACQFEANGSPCTSDANACTTDLCNATGTCIHAPGNFGSVCRAAAGTCDVAESCTGTSSTCPANLLASSSTVCRSAAGVCDVSELCTGSSASCPANGFSSSVTTCRLATGICDPSETCTGSSAACPANLFSATTVTCRAASGICNPAETCTGSSSNCPADLFAGTTSVCRNSVGVCDPQETCTGTSSTCPANLLASSSTVCRAAAGSCDASEVCTGTSASCPANAFTSSAAVCRPAAGICDPSESCSGSSAACPADLFSATTVTCRAASGVCDPAETCSGSSANCPSDVFAGTSSVCRSSAGACDVAESCTGTSSTCPVNVLAPSSTVCRAAAGTCDVAEACTGTSLTCPANAFAAGSTPCLGGGGACDAGLCNGTGNCISADVDGDASADGCDNCPGVFNADQLNSDCPDPSFSQSDCPAVSPDDAGCCDGGDLCDACPAQSDNDNCEAGGTGGATIDSTGGSFSTADGSVTVEVPAGALADDTSITVTENGSVSDFTLYSGAVLSVSARPEGQHFDEPVTITVQWKDRDADDLVDLGVCIGGGVDDGLSCDTNSDCSSTECSAAASVGESELVLKRNAAPFSSGGFEASPFDCDAHLSGACATADANCNDAAGSDLSSVAGCCNKTTNEWTFKTCNFSEYVVGDPVAGLIPGGGPGSSDCAAEWVVDNPLNSPPADKHGFPNTLQNCRDGDATCDTDGIANGSCSFRVAVCLNVSDPRLLDRKTDLVACTPSAVEVWAVRKPRPDSKPPGAANGTALRDAVQALGTAAVSGKHGETLTFTPAVSAAPSCSEFVSILVPLKNGSAAGKAIVKSRATVTSGDVDTDKLKLVCLPAP